MADVHSRKGGFSHDSPLLPRPAFPRASPKQKLVGQSEAGGGRCFAMQPIRTAEPCKPGTTLLSESRERRAVIGQ